VRLARAKQSIGDGKEARMRELNHELCSEYLPRFLAGDLEQEQGAAVELHLAECAECRAERHALEALTRPVPTLSAAERAQLHSTLDRDLPASAGGIPALAPGRERRPRWRSRLAPALGAAAVVALAAVGVATISGGLGDVAGQGASEVSGEGGGQADSAAGQAAESAPAEFSSPAASPHWIGSLGSVTAAELSRKGERGRELRFVAESFQAAGARAKSEAFTDELVTRAPAGLEDDIRACVKQVTGLGYTALPAFGARARLEGRDVLVLGFAWTPTRGSLDRFMVWAFAGDACDPVSYQAGSVAEGDR
jgi:Putative zinc-finger